MLKKEHLVNLGYGESRALVPAGKNDDARSMVSKSSSRTT